MGDVSAEPSMEDILSSIKRIIAEEGDGAVAARAPRRAPARPTPPPMLEPVEDDEEVLELNEPAPSEPAPAEPAPRPASPAVAARVTPAPPAALVPPTAPAPSTEPIVSREAEEAARSPLAALSRLVVKPEVSGGDTLEGLVREMLRPMLRDWLDANLPAMVEFMVAKEIARITGTSR